MRNKQTRIEDEWYSSSVRTDHLHSQGELPEREPFSLLSWPDIIVALQEQIGKQLPSNIAMEAAMKKEAKRRPSLQHLHPTARLLHLLLFIAKKQDYGRANDA